MSERVVLLAVDGLEWTRIRGGAAAGRLPQFRRLIDEGAYAEVAVAPAIVGLAGAAEPMNSPTLWTSIATGQHFFQHGVYDFSNLLDPADELPLFESRHVRSPRIWDVLTQREIPSLVVGYYVTHPAYPICGAMVSDLFGEVASRTVAWPENLCDALAAELGAADYDEYLRTFGSMGHDPAARTARRDSRVDSAGRGLRSEILTRFTDLSAGETARLLDDAPGSRARRLIEFRLVYPFVRDDRALRQFLSLIEDQPWRFATVYLRLVDFVSHGFWTEGNRLPDDFVRAYGGVVDRAYAWIDDAIGRVRATLDEDDRLIVLSDHGFAASGRNGELESAADISELSYGHHAEPAFLAVAGGAARGPIADVTLLDIAPSILDYFGVEQAEALDGGPVPALLHEGAPRKLARVAAYAYSPPAKQGRVSSEEQKQVMARLAALGYVDE